MNINPLFKVEKDIKVSFNVNKHIKKKERIQKRKK